METTITASERDHGYVAGDVLQVSTPDRRWWKRLWHFVTFRAPPMKVERVTVIATSETTMTIIS